MQRSGGTDRAGCRCTPPDSLRLDELSLSSVDLDLARLALHFLLLRNVDGDDAVPTLGADGLLVCVLWQREATCKRTVEPLDAMHLLRLVALLLLALARQRQYAVLNGDVHVFLADFR